MGISFGIAPCPSGWSHTIRTTQHIVYSVVLGCSSTPQFWPLAAAVGGEEEDSESSSPSFFSLQSINPSPPLWRCRN